MSETLCQCGHGKRKHAACQWECYECVRPNCTDFTPPPTREPIRLTGEAEAAAWQEYSGRPVGKGNPIQPMFSAGFRAARLAGGPTLADARTPESEDTE